MTNLGNPERYKLTYIQFVFSNPDAIPAVVRKLSHTFVSGIVSGSGTGKLLTANNERCSVADLPEIMSKANMQLVGMSIVVKETLRKDLWVVRFVFVPQAAATPNEHFLTIKEQLEEAFASICNDSLWRLRAFDNPYFINGEPSDDRMLSVDLDARVPLYDEEGQPILVWRRDAENEKIGSHKLPVKPASRLHYPKKNLLLVNV